MRFLGMYIPSSREIEEERKRLESLHVLYMEYVQELFKRLMTDSCLPTGKRIEKDPSWYRKFEKPAKSH